MVLLLGFVTAYTIGLFAYGQAVGSPLANLYTGLNLVLFGVFAVIQRFARLPLPVLWGLALIGLGNMVGGVLLVDGNPLYLTPVLGPVRYDKVFHTAASAVGAWVCWVALGRWAGAGADRRGLYLSALLMTLGAGAVVEMAEFLGSVFNPEVNVGDYGNNLLDMVANLAGAVAGLAWVAVRSEAEQSTTPARIANTDRG